MSEIQLTPGTLKTLQAYVGAKIEARGFAHETLNERLLLLTEEVGELVKACRKYNGIKVDQNRPNTTKPGEEITDVINMIMAVGIELGLDIETEYRKKEAIIDERVYGPVKTN